ncbi:unnamed protein product [Spodoptera exigua]|nr:unnamed protein product [Spodoptera exigua]
MEAMERRGKLAAIAAIIFIVFWSQCRGVEGQRNNTKMSYVCPPQFIRLGHSCYYFSENKATWQNALFACTKPRRPPRSLANRSQSARVPPAEAAGNRGPRDSTSCPPVQREPHTTAYSAGVTYVRVFLDMFDENRLSRLEVMGGMSIFINLMLLR